MEPVLDYASSTAHLHNCFMQGIYQATLMLAGLSHLPAASSQEDAQQRIKAVTKDLAPADGTLTLPGVSPEVLQQQFLFAIAVHEDAGQLAEQLWQLRQAKQSLLQAARTGVVNAERENNTTSCHAVIMARVSAWSCVSTACLSSASSLCLHVMQQSFFLLF